MKWQRSGSRKRPKRSTGDSRPAAFKRDGKRRDVNTEPDPQTRKTQPKAPTIPAKPATISIGKPLHEYVHHTHPDGTPFMPVQRPLDPRGPFFEFQLDAQGKVTGVILEQQGPQGPQRTLLGRK